MPASANRLTIALAQIPAIVGDIAGNRDRLREAREGGRGLRRRHPACARALSLGLSARGSGAEARVPGGLPGGLRGAGALDRRRRPGDAGRPALGRRGRQAAQRHGAPRRRADRGGAVQGRSAQLRRVRREARVRSRARRRGRSSFAACGVGVPICEDIWGPDPVECILETGGEILLVRQRLALRARQARDPPERGGRARRRERAAAHLSQHGRRPGRARVRRRLVRAQRRPQP